MTIRNRPIYAVTDTVRYLVKTEAHGVKFEKWIDVYVTQCKMISTESGYAFSYVLQVSHPDGYTGGSETIHIDERALDELQEQYRTTQE